MRKQWGFLWQSRHSPNLRRKACDLWARTHATGEQSELVSTSRILYFYSHDRRGAYSFFNLGETVQLIQLTLKCSLEWAPQQASHCPCWPFGGAKQKQFSCYALCTHPPVSVYSGVLCNWDNLKEPGGNKTPTPTPHSEAEMLPGLHPCGRNTSQNSCKSGSQSLLLPEKCHFNGLDHYPSLSFGGNARWLNLSTTHQCFCTGVRFHLL